MSCTSEDWTIGIKIARQPYKMNLFIYGTLMVPKIWDTVTLCPDPVSIAGELFHHRIQRVKHGDFPAIVADPDSPSPIPGLVIQNVSVAALDRLDQYEDEFYERVSVSIITEKSTIEAQVYRVPLELANEILSTDLWSLEWFEEEALERYWNRLFA